MHPDGWRTSRGDSSRRVAELPRGGLAALEIPAPAGPQQGEHVVNGQPVGFLRERDLGAGESGNGGVDRGAKQVAQVVLSAQARSEPAEPGEAVRVGPLQDVDEAGIGGRITTGSGPIHDPSLDSGATEGALDLAIYGPESCLRDPVRLARDMLHDLGISRELAWRLFVRNLSAQYRQTALGYVWAFLPPLVTALLWIFINQTGLVSIGDTRLPYPLYVLVGTLLWQVFVDAVDAPLRLMTQSQSMLARIKFPREALVLAAIGEVVFNFLIRSVLLIGTLVYFEIPLSLQAVACLPGVVGIVLLGTVIGLLLSPIGLLYHDVQRAVLLLTQAWFYLTPIIYPTPTEGIGALVARFNPVAPLVIHTRELLTAGRIVSAADAAAVAAASALCLVAGWVLYRAAMPHIVERLSA